MPRDDLIVLRNGTAAEWASANPTLADGEPGAETDTGVIKIGNGSDSWNGLPNPGGGDIVAVAAYNLTVGAKTPQADGVVLFDGLDGLAQNGAGVISGMDPGVYLLTGGFNMSEADDGYFHSLIYTGTSFVGPQQTMVNGYGACHFDLPPYIYLGPGGTMVVTLSSLDATDIANGAMSMFRLELA